MQSFACTNDCKSYFYFYFWSAIVHTYERLQVIFYLFISRVQSFATMNDCKPYVDCDFWSAIVRTYEQLQVIFLFLFLECNRSHVRMIANHIFIFISGVQLFTRTDDFKSFFIFYFWSVIIHMYEQLQVIYFLFLGVARFACVNTGLLTGLRAWIDGHGLMHHTKTL